MKQLLDLPFGWARRWIAWEPSRVLLVLAAYVLGMTFLGQWMLWICLSALAVGLVYSTLRSARHV